MKTRKTPKGRKCSIYNHPEVETINLLIGTKSNRAISRHIQGDDKMRDAISRHEKNSLSSASPLDYAEPAPAAEWANLSLDFQPQSVALAETSPVEEMKRENINIDSAFDDGELTRAAIDETKREMISETTDCLENKSNEELAEAIRRRLLRFTNERKNSVNLPDEVRKFLARN